MAKTIHKQGVCIECGGEHRREQAAWRCWPCDGAVSRAQQAVRKVLVKAIQAGTLKPAKELICVDCGAQAHDYDHRDYSKPLDVDPVCRKCNQQRGPALFEMLAA